MTPLADLLEDFGTTTTEPRGSISAEDLETLRLDSFEQGYKAGWDDAVQAQSDDQRNISSVFAQNLLDLSFTYNEAYAHMIKGLKPLLTDITTKILPELMHATIGHRVSEELLRCVANSDGLAEVVIHTPEENTAAVETLLEQDFSFPVSVRPDPSLAPGQVHLSFDNKEIELNFNELIAEFTAAIEAFTHELSPGENHERRDAS